MVIAIIDIIVLNDAGGIEQRNQSISDRAALDNQRMFDGYNHDIAIRAVIPFLPQ